MRSFVGLNLNAGGGERSGTLCIQSMARDARIAEFSTIRPYDLRHGGANDPASHSTSVKRKDDKIIPSTIWQVVYWTTVWGR